MQPRLTSVVPVVIAAFWATYLVAFAAPGAFQLVQHSAVSSDQTTASQATIVYTAAKRYEGLAWLHGGERFPEGAALMMHDDKGEHVLSGQFAAASDANVSFDGKTVLFSGKQHASETWQAWELTLPDEKLQRLTNGSDDIVRPMYLPEGRIVYARKTGGRFVMEALSRIDGTVMALSYAPGNYLPTDVLLDGRILFESSYPLGTNGAAEIYTVYSDGTGVEAYRCDHGIRRSAGRQVSSGDIVFLSGNGLARFTSSLAHQASLHAPAGDYAGDVAETASHSWLAAWRADARQPYQIKEWDPSGKIFRSLLSLRGMNLIEPVVIAPRTAPNHHPSTLRDWTAANLLTLNAYSSKHQFLPGSISTVRIYTLDKAGHRALLGNAPVEKDGSLYVHVPGDQPLQFELMSNSGKVLEKESGWMWTRKSEQRICVGCHAGPEHAPDNEVPAVLLHSIVPADLTGVQISGGKGSR